MRRDHPWSRNRDTDNGYGWVSIALHWLSMLVVVFLLILGSSIGSGGPTRASLLDLHTSVAGSAWLLLWWRILRRFYLGHPGPARDQRQRLFGLGKFVHQTILVALGLMLLSGPLLVWSRGAAIAVFELSIPAPFAASSWLAAAMYWVHSWSALTVATGTTLHIIAAFKHVAIDRDGTFDKMMIAAKLRPERPMTPDSLAHPTRKP